jgi:hypothetical protein
VQLLRYFPISYGTRRFITVFTRALQWSLFSAGSIQSMPPHPVSLRAKTSAHMQTATGTNRDQWTDSKLLQREWEKTAHTAQTTETIAQIQTAADRTKSGDQRTDTNYSRQNKERRPSHRYKLQHTEQRAETIAQIQTAPDRTKRGNQCTNTNCSWQNKQSRSGRKQDAGRGAILFYRTTRPHKW